MEKKKCNKCEIEKDVTLFRKRKTSKDGLRNECKDCSYIVYKKHSEKNSERLKERRKRYNLLNSDNIKRRNRDYRLKNLETLREKDRIKRLAKRKKNPEYIDKEKQKLLQKEKNKEYKRKWTQENRERIKQKVQDKKENNPEFVQAIRDYKIKYYQKNKKRIIELRAIRRQTDSFYNVSNSLRNRINEYVKKRDFTKRNKTFDIIGCTPQEFREHLEKQFKGGISWDNYGFYGWHIDHIIPLCLATTEDELYKLCHYTNLQPLWGTENMKKGGKIL